MEYLILAFSVINFLLGIIILIHTKRERENIVFLVFALSASLWTFNNFYLRFHPTVELLRLSYALGIFVATLGFIWVYFFLKKRISLLIKSAVLPYAAFLFLLTLFSNTIISILDKITVFGYVGQLGDLFFLYSTYIGFIVLVLIHRLTNAYRNEKNRDRKKQIYTVLVGAGIFAIASFTISFLIPTFFHTFEFTILDNFSFSIFLIFIVYGIMQYQLFNVKVIATELITFSLWVFIFVRIVISSADRLVNIATFIISVILGTLLIRSVLGEVRTREEIQKLATELEFANKELKRLDQAKSEFISIASHQLRTPLSIIKGYLSLIREGNFGDVSNVVKKTMNKVYLSNERLIKLVADLLDLSRMESGKLQYEFADFNFNALVDSIADEFKIPMADKGLAMTLHMPEAPISVWGDSWKLRQVIFNLIDNSLKYTKAGSINISLQKNDDSVVLAVKDTGVGMSAETMKNLFQKFARGYDSNKINVQGLGLGLFIAKKIVDDHKGELSITSEGEGKGSTFILTLPLKKA